MTRRYGYVTTKAGGYLENWFLTGSPSFLQFVLPPIFRSRNVRNTTIFSRRLIWEDRVHGYFTRRRHFEEEESIYHESETAKLYYLRNTFIDELRDEQTVDRF